MPELPRLSGQQAIKTFEALGFSIVRQKGSHVVLRRGEKGCVIPFTGSWPLALSEAPSNKQALRSRSSQKH
jgi:predicted RNA binding protein YcfA (HicA-like mRNA interferase family)